MKIIDKIIVVAVLLLAAAAYSCERHGADTQNDKSDENGIGAAKDEEANTANDANTTNNAQNDSTPSDNNVSSSNSRQGGDTDFVLAAADGGMLEVQLAALANQNGSAKDVKDFASAMTKDHGKANDELKDLAKKSNISIPNDLSEKSRQKYDELAQKKGKEFDNAYSKLMVADHQQTIEKFRTEANSGQVAEIKNWAAAKIPNLEHHLKMANKLNGARNTSQSH